MIKAIGSDIQSDSFGVAVKSAVDKVKDDVQVRYGAPRPFDFLMPGSIWNNPQDWLTGVSKGERQYGYIWERPAGADPKVWRGVKSVGVFANAGYQKGWFSIEYDFDNMDACNADLKNQAAKSL